MSYGGRLLAGLRSYCPDLLQTAEFALNEARVWGKREGENAVQVRLTGAEGMTTEGLALWRKVAMEYLCYVSVGYTADAWSCSITCPDTGVTGVQKQLDPESALRACVAKWAAKVQTAFPDRAAPGVTVP